MGHVCIVALGVASLRKTVTWKTLASSLTWRRKAGWEILTLEAFDHERTYGMCVRFTKGIDLMPAFRIVVIGAGETGTPLLQQLLNAPFVQVLGVADLNLNLPGIALARQHQVPVTDDFMDLVRQGSKVDIIIDVTGAGNVREQLRQYMVESHNTHTIIMHEQIALLMMSLSAGALVDSKHGLQQYA